ncbi:OmpA family protein [Sphingobium boeckii]|uniref:Outer membrane protein OmpA-like peptidoglycan-associated protein/opacity protein-like surface antigen n=1 Tax=Sphingobium boeckii TaxID=1082345 RepID=A0A7W9AHM3_9SPHN|nr:OmpA family protein [Sphingobium boeckii]MBB5685814.1 outer membrane protein OmpA-like peptidoglycan-associated protein/opacity protein-like surface antigen [Sphingobium boeckii]
MRKLAITLALASTAIASPALAKDGAWYIGVEGGAMLVEDFDLDISTATTTGSGTVDSDYGYDFDGIIGYDFGGFRAEAEVGYKSAAVDGYSSTVGTPFGPLPSTAVAGNYDYAGGKTTALSFMINGLLDFGDDDGLQGFIGGGAGVARVKADDYALTTTGGFLNDSDTGFAWQALAGIRAPLTDNIDVGLKYRFFNAPNVDLVDRIGRDVETRFRSHSILGSLIFNFGAPEPVEEVVAPPPPVYTPPPAPVVQPPVEPVVQCEPGPYIVFFDWDKSNITPEAAGTLDAAVTEYGDCGQAKVMIAGHADRSGSDKYNVGLSQRRNKAVQDYLVSKSIPASVIAAEAFGESVPKVPTADGVREAQNRRVEITYGPGSGM